MPSAFLSSVLETIPIMFLQLVSRIELELDMRFMCRSFLSLIFIGILSFARAGEQGPPPPPNPAPFGPAQKVGRLQDDRLTECSGLDASPTSPDLFWAVNDSGNGPFLYALGEDGRNRGRVRVAGARNHDWEELSTFTWRGKPMILVADFGDNRQRRDAHTLYVVEEPRLVGERLDESAIADVVWRIDFSYPDRPHDAESAAVDSADEKVLVLTKRDDPPLLFEVPLKPSPADSLVTARKITNVDRIPSPSLEDLTRKYGMFYSQPTALDLSPDGRLAAVLTYKYAYLFHRGSGDSWAAAFSRDPVPIPLPLARDFADLSQREAICFTLDGRALLATSEGQGAGIYRLDSRD